MRHLVGNFASQMAIRVRAGEVQPVGQAIIAHTLWQFFPYFEYQGDDGDEQDDAENDKEQLRHEESGEKCAAHRSDGGCHL